MSSPIDLAKLIVGATKDAILAKMLTTASALGLQTESWQSGDPTRELMDVISTVLAAREDDSLGALPTIIKGGLLGLAAKEWLTNLAYYNFNTQRTDATFASCTMQLTNSTGADFGTFDAEDATFENPHTTSAPTYRNTTPFTLGPHATVTFTVEAEVAGSGGNSDPGDIDTINSPGMPGVTATNLTAATGSDEESDDNLTKRAQAKFESLSPNGPRGAYFYAATTPSLQSDGSGTTNVTRVRVIEDSDNGKAIVYIAGDSGALVEADRIKADNTIRTLATPFCVSPITVLATNNVIPITYSLWVYDDIGDTIANIKANVAAALLLAFKGRAIGGDSITPGVAAGFIFQDWIRAQIIEAVAPFAFKCDISLPAGDVPIALSTDWTLPAAEVAVLGTINATVNFKSAPA